MKVRKMTIDQARRGALGAQGFSRTRPSGRIDVRHFRRLFDTIGLLQLDSVNVIERSHYLPVHARLGSYDKAALDRFTAESGEIFEYWGHEASLLPVELYPYLKHRMEEMRPWGRVTALLDDRPEYLDRILAEIAERGPLTVGDLKDPGSRTGSWWGWGEGKIALEWLFATGQIAAYRTKNFARLYDLPERVIAASHRTAPAVDKETAYRHLLRLSASHHGLGTLRDLADYYRLHVPTARPILAAMGAEGVVKELEVEGWQDPVYADPDLAIPRRIVGSALLSPFDPVVWERDRAERLFDFRYRIEIYVPKPKRVYGYYVLPFLLDGELVGRVDLKADRKEKRLLVQAAHIEEGRDPQRVGAAMMGDLRAMAKWLDLDEVIPTGGGNLALSG